MKAGGIVGLFILMSMGVMLADALSKPQGVNALFNGLGGLWKTGVNGMLGKTA